MTEKSWSSLAKSDSPNEQLAWAGAVMEDMDSGRLRPLETTPDELLALGREGQVEFQRPVKEMIKAVNGAIADADRRNTESITAPPEFGWEVVEAAEVDEINNRKQQRHFDSNLGGVAEAGSLAEKYEKIGSSSLYHASYYWNEKIGKKLTATDVLIFDVSDVLSNEYSPVGFEITALPIIAGDVEKTKALAGAVRDALARLNTLAEDKAVQDVLDDYDKNPLTIARSRDVLVGLQERTAPLRMYAEAIMTSAQLLAMATADAPPEVDMGMAACVLAKVNAFEKSAKAVPMGTVGPLSLSGKVPEGGLVKLTDQGMVFDEEYAQALQQSTKDNQRATDIAIGIEAAYRKLQRDTEASIPGDATPHERMDIEDSVFHSALGQLSLSQRSSIDQYKNEGYLVGNGCPAVFYDKENGGSPIKLTTGWLLRPYMPKRG